jgi:hypothetical protein
MVAFIFPYIQKKKPIPCKLNNAGQAGPKKSKQDDTGD